MSELEIRGIKNLIKEELEDLTQRVEFLEANLSDSQPQTEQEDYPEDYPEDEAETEEEQDFEEAVDQEILEYQEFDRKKEEERKRALEQIENSPSGQRVDKTLIKKIQGHSHIEKLQKGLRESQEKKFKDPGYDDDFKEINEESEDDEEDLSEFEEKD